MDFNFRWFLTISVLLSIAAAHPGRHVHHVHHGADHSHQRRQDGGAPFVGIEMLSTPGGSDSSTPILIIDTRTSRLTSQPISITVSPVAIATICPPGARPNTTSTPNTSAALSPNLPEAKTARLLPAEESTLLRLNFAGANETLAVVPTFTGYDGSGCSTLYTRTSSAVCSTVLTGLGAILVSITDCLQSITFSTSTGYEPLPTAATNKPPDIGEIKGKQLTYFAAPWYEIANGRVPNSVLVKICAAGMGGDGCGTATEWWSVVNQTSSVDVTSSLAFEGMVTGVSAGCKAS
jgi:hypothetical protein